MKTQKAFTLIELLLLVSLVAFITVTSLTGFLISSERLEFQNQSSDIQNILTTHRAQAFNNSQNNLQYKTNISTTEISTFIEDTESQTQTTQQTLTFQDPILIKQFNAKPLNQTSWTKSNSNFEILINSTTRKCEITSPSQPNTEFTILEIPIYKTDQATPSKFLYIHRESCLIETLNTQIHN